MPRLLPLSAVCATLRHRFDRTPAKCGIGSVAWVAVILSATPARTRAVELAPEFRFIPAAQPHELTPANGWPSNESLRDWTRSLGGPTSNRFSALSQITPKNVGALKVAWTYHSNDGTGNIQCNPVIVGSAMYVATAGHNIACLDAGTGRERWRFKPEKKGTGLQDLPARRGFVYWQGDRDAPPRLFFTAGYWIYALEPETGTPVREFGLDGRTPLPTGAGVTGAVWNRVLVVPGFNRDVFGYDAATGKMLWQFHTVPQPGEFGHDTWQGLESGANCWGGMSLDESRGIAYIATGSPKPNFVGTGHLGENLFANCVIALDASTGQRLWHFQEIRHDIWDLDIPAPPNLVTVVHEGRRIDAVAQVTKIGHTLLLDRVTGKPLFPIRLRRAPASVLPGEKTWPYQPDLELPQPFAKQGFERSDITDRTPESRAFVEHLLSRANFGWFTAFELARPTVFLGVHGGAEWTGAAVDPVTARLYVSSNHVPWLITVFRDDDPLPAKPSTAGEEVFQRLCAACHGADRKGIGMVPPLRGLRHQMDDAAVLSLLKTGKNAMPPSPPMTTQEQSALLNFLFARDRPTNPTTVGAAPRYSFTGYNKLLDADGYPGSKPPWGTLNCIDLNTGKLEWRVPLGEYAALTSQGVPVTGTENFGGAIVTAGGLVFCSGTRDNRIRAFNAQTGIEEWNHALPLHGTAPPATYQVEGRQFVVQAATGGGKLGGPTGDAWIAFALPQAASADSAPRSEPHTQPKYGDYQRANR